MSKITTRIFQPEDDESALSFSESSDLEALTKKLGAFVRLETDGFNKEHPRLHAIPHFHFEIEIWQET